MCAKIKIGTNLAQNITTVLKNPATVALDVRPPPGLLRLKETSDLLSLSLELGCAHYLLGLQPFLWRFLLLLQCVFLTYSILIVIDLNKSNI